MVRNDASDTATRDAANPGIASDGSPRLGWIVDVQFDFMRPAEQGGRLYVKHLADPLDSGAVQVEPAIARVAAWMREHCDGTVFTGDWHTDDDAEISRTSPDFVTTYPAHCMGAG